MDDLQFRTAAVIIICQNRFIKVKNNFNGSFGRLYFHTIHLKVDVISFDFFQFSLTLQLVLCKSLSFFSFALTYGIYHKYSTFGQSRSIRRGRSDSLFTISVNKLHTIVFICSFNKLFSRGTIRLRSVCSKCNYVDGQQGYHQQNGKKQRK